ncbi:MAG TPA: AEC family transporter [Pseudogracilibacillus sp.]|nr:AEC family transporter [Pseudogracilibacillus sp.]
MLEFFYILKEIILPVFLVLIVGYIVQIKYKLDLQTIAKLNIYIFVPAFIFVKLYETTIAPSIFVLVISFMLVYVLILYVIGILISRAMKLDKKKRVTFTNSVIFFNSGNFGVPVNDLVFRSDPFAISIQVIVLMFQNIFLFSYGVFSLQSLDSGKLKALFAYFKMPVMYAMLLGILLNALDLKVSEVIMIPTTYLADGMIALALLMLGMQVAEMKLTKGLGTVYVSLIIRLLLGPLIALALIYLFGISGILAQALFIASAMPTSVNSAVIAQEYKNHPDYAAQIVLFSTVFSAITVSLVIYVARILFAG